MRRGLMLLSPCHSSFTRMCVLTSISYRAQYVYSQFTQYEMNIWSSHNQHRLSIGLALGGTSTFKIQNWFHGSEKVTTSLKQRKHLAVRFIYSLQPSFPLKLLMWACVTDRSADLSVRHSLISASPLNSPLCEQQTLGSLRPAAVPFPSLEQDFVCLICSTLWISQQPLRLSCFLLASTSHGTAERWLLWSGVAAAAPGRQNT